LYSISRYFICANNCSSPTWGANLKACSPLVLPTVPEKWLCPSRSSHKLNPFHCLVRSSTTGAVVHSRDASGVEQRSAHPVPPLPRAFPPWPNSLLREGKSRFLILDRNPGGRSNKQQTCASSPVERMTSGELLHHTVRQFAWQRPPLNHESAPLGIRAGVDVRVGLD
jgi:hypothetical protein